MKKKHGIRFVLGTMLGSTLGALSSMIFTTKKGAERQRVMLNQHRSLGKAAKKCKSSSSKTIKKNKPVAKANQKRKGSSLKRIKK